MLGLKVNPLKAKVDLVEDVDLAVRVFRRGTRQIGQPCRLMISLNGVERLHFSEEVGDRAPSLVVIDLRMPGDPGEILMSALRSKPWRSPECPVIIYAPEDDGLKTDDSLGYLVKSAPVDHVLETIRDALDLDDVSALSRPQPQNRSWLDVAVGEG